MKKFICITLSILLVCSSFCGCQANVESGSQEPPVSSSPTEMKKKPVEHILYNYNLWFLCGYCDRNLTDPADRSHNNNAASFYLVKSADELGDLVALDGTIGEFAERNHLTEDTSYILDEELNFPLLSLADDAANFTPDEAFFAKHNLLVVDICGGNGALNFRMTPVNLVIRESHATVDVYYSGDYSSTADMAGCLCLVPVPKDCLSAEVNFIHNEENSNYFNPME